MALYFKKKSEFLYPRMLYARFGWNWPCRTEVENFEIFSIYFYYFALSPLEEGCGSLFVKIWIPSTQGYLVPNLVEIGPVVLKREFLNIFNIILIFRFYLPFEKDGAFHLNKLQFPSPKDALCQVWLKLAQCFWRGRFFNIFNIILHFRYHFPLEKGKALHLNKLESLHPRMLCANLVETCPVVLEKKSKIGKVYRQTDGQKDDGRRAIRKAHLSFQLRWAKK